MLKYIFCLFFILITDLTYAEKFEAGKDYELVAQATSAKSNKPKIVEFFSYGCHWCYQLEPTLNKWVMQQKERIYFKRIPVVFNADWEFFAKAYYVSKALNIEPKMSPILFKSILDEKQSLTSNQALTEFFIKNGVDSAMAKSAFNYSPSIEMKIKEGLKYMQEYHISSVPTLIINGKYKTNLQMATSEKRLFEIVEYLVDNCHSRECGNPAAL